GGWPALIGGGVAVKLWIAGSGLTVTVAVFVAVWPAPSFTVSVYVVVAAGETKTEPPLAIAPTPWSMLPVPPLYAAKSDARSPAARVVGEAVKLWIAGSGLTTTVALAVAT